MTRKSLPSYLLSLVWGFFVLLPRTGRCSVTSAVGARGGLNCSDPRTAPWLVACQVDLPPFERWIWANKGQFLEINQLRMHYVDIGGDQPGGGDRVYVFLHGQPTWSYLWRNIAKVIGGCRNADFPEFPNACDGPDIPGVARALMYDYVGFGRSDKPPIDFDDSGETVFDYSISSHAVQLEGLLDALGLGSENGGPSVILVAHDWGGGIGLGYLGRRPGNVAGFICFECIMFTNPTSELSMNQRSGPGTGCCGFSDQLRTVQAWEYVFKTHLFADVLMPRSQTNLSEAEQKFYR